MFSVSPKFVPLSIEKAVPTALGRWLAIVLVCGGIFNNLLPITLCLPPLIGSSEDATKESRRSLEVWSPLCE